MKKTLTTAALVAVTYIGRRENYTDRLFGTGLAFEQGQTRRMPADVARKFLKHTDQFELAGKHSEQLVEPPVEDDTAALLEAARLAKEVEAKRLDELQALYDQIAVMDKAGLVDFAKNKYRQEVSAKSNLTALRAQVTGFIDMYGVV